MTPTTPYSSELEGRDPLLAIKDGGANVVALAERWTPEQFERRSAPGKWTAREIIIHLAQSEMAFGARARTALTVDDLQAPSFEQDGWFNLESGTSGALAVQLFKVLSQVNLALYSSLSVAQRQTPFTHAEYGRLTVDWLIRQQAGHLVHHMRQLEALSAPA